MKSGRSFDFVLLAITQNIIQPDPDEKVNFARLIEIYLTIYTTIFY